MAPQRAPDDLDTFLEPLLGFAHDMLRRHGEFYPFGATMDLDGAIALIAAHTGDEHPGSQELIDLMVGGMRAQARDGVIRAAAICYDIRFQPDGGGVTDAIAVSLEHRDGKRAIVVEPYAKGRLTGWRFQPLLALAPPEPRIFLTDVTAAVRPH